MNIEVLERAYNKLCKAYELLKNSDDPDSQEAFRDSCIKRFEFTLEQARKHMSRYLQTEYSKSKDELKTKNVFRLMQGFSFIQSWERWSEYTELRNSTAHEYSEEKAIEIISLLPQFIEDVAYLIKQYYKELAEN